MFHVCGNQHVLVSAGLVQRLHTDAALLHAEKVVPLILSSVSALGLTNCGQSAPVEI